MTSDSPLTRADVERLRSEVEFPARLDLSARNLRGINLSYFDLQGANLRGADLREAILRGVNLKYADLRGARLNHADLDGADLSYANLGDSETNWADLRDARLSYATLRGLDLRGFDLSGLDMQNADLNETDLRGAQLHGTRLWGADLSTARVQWSELRNARLHQRSSMPEQVPGSHLSGYLVEGASIMTSDRQQRVPITTERLKEIRFVGDMSLLADGKRVAFEVRESPPGQTKTRTRIWTVERGEMPDSQPQLLTHGKKDDVNPRWSPDGTQLAFISTGEGEKDKPQLHLIAATGGEARQVCSMPNGVSDLAWSPDGSRIAFLSVEGAEPSSDPRVFTPADARHRRLWTVRVDDDIPSLVTPDGIAVWEYAWSPDGKEFALYYSTRSDDTGWYHSQIGVVDANGGAIRQLTNFAPVSMQARGLAWSPDGKQLAYLSGKWSDPGRGAGDIYLLSLENGQSRNLTPGIACSPTWCAWFPDNRRLLYAAVDGVSHQFGILDTLDGSITVLDRDFVTRWDQPRPSPTPDLRTFVTVHSTPEQPPDVYSGTLVGENGSITGIEWQRLTRLNPIPEETWAWPVTQAIHYPGIDGQTVNALFTLPINYTGDPPPPLFVDVHGGPSGAYCATWGGGYPLILASAGYAVLRVNYRGSWGNGAAFADAVMGDVGGKDFQDIMAGIDYLIAQGLVDGNRLAIGGWSNGGFLSAWAVTQTTRFKAAMMGAGISDWLNMHAQTNIPDADILQLLVDPLEQPEVYHQHSPITFANRVKTPTLILHGENDPAVPVAQAYTFYRALCERNVPAELVVYPREGHGLDEWEHLIDADRRLLQWLERYV